MSRSVATPAGRDAGDEAPSPDLMTRLLAAGVDRRAFLRYCAALTATLAMPPRFAPRVAEALTAVDRPALVWLEFQDCAGDTESFLRARDPSVAQLVLDLLSVDYHETIMAAAGTQAEAARDATLARGGHLVVVEGSVPLGAGGGYCTVGGRSAEQILKAAAAKAAAVVNVGTCSAYGGLPAADPNPTQAVPVEEVISGVPVLNLPGCPVNADNLTATLAHYLTFGALPPADDLGRPLFAYGERIHDNCPRRGHFDAGEFALEWGDEGHRKGWCLYRLGCKGPSTFHNCPIQQWNGGTNWPIGAGHGCVGCTEPGFWDDLSPFYDRLPHVTAGGLDATAEQIGLAVAGASAAIFAAHGAGKVVQHRLARRREHAAATQDGDAHE
ncbi:hydrogenase small subunit [Actinomadura sp. ATCC 31491]|uniref:Hydrogenase small subunit n=1 Tax=Actinomadura luzonensis TaxID=2805427 RepID=A0ABT0FX84_9ACTN|nr:hydrogenase small subunit [Actinomadura luzonensis]MCK2216954.1 hydrogenase small subunit [Actinomadura luzonensis]